MNGNNYNYISHKRKAAAKAVFLAIAAIAGICVFAFLLNTLMLGAV